MTKQELIDHLQHLEQYTHYSEDAPALREVIEMLECSEIPNGSEERTQERTETHACDLISRQAAIAEFSCCELTPDGGIDANYAIDFLKHMPSAQSMDVQEAYYLGKIDGIKECTERLKRVTEEIDNERNKDRSDQQTGCD